MEEDNIRGRSGLGSDVKDDKALTLDLSSSDVIWVGRLVVGGVGGPPLLLLLPTLRPTSEEDEDINGREE